MAQPNAMQLNQQNLMARQAVVGNSVKMKQQIFSQSIDPTAQTTINITGNAIRNVGLLLGFIVEIEGTVTTGNTGTATRTPMGCANLLTQIRFDDLSNFTRIQVPGWHMAMLNTLRQGFGYGGVYANNLPMGYGDNFEVFKGPATIPVSTAQELRMNYFVPIAYSNNDLRGAIWMSTVSAVSNLQLELNANPISNAGNPINHVYTGNNAAAGGWTGNVVVTVYQVYLDQVPRMENGQPILPVLDLNTIYDLKQTTFTTPTDDQDFPMAYSNFRSFLSTIAVLDNGGVYNGGSDVNYWSLAAANFTNIFKVSPEQAALDARASLMTDCPDGTYLFESRDTPINTINFGNMELNLNGTGLANNARVLVGYEAFGIINQLVGASSLAGG